MTNRKIEYWVIPPEADAEFVANMEEVLETYAKPYDPTHPVLCMDEQPVQLVKETRKSDRSHREASSARRLRVRAGRHGEYLHVHRTPLRMADGNRAAVENESGLGAGNGAGCSTAVTRGVTK